MMDTPFTRIVEGINHTLENVIAPEVQSSVVRGQLFAAVEILSQIQDRFDYKHDLIVEDIQVSQKMLHTLKKALQAAQVQIPEDFLATADEIDVLRMNAEQLVQERGRMEALVSAALDLLDTNRSVVAEAETVELTVLGQLGKNLYRNMLLVRQQQFDKISQRTQQE